MRNFTILTCFFVLLLVAGCGSPKNIEPDDWSIRNGCNNTYPESSGGPVLNYQNIEINANVDSEKTVEQKGTNEPVTPIDLAVEIRELLDRVSPPVPVKEEEVEEEEVEVEEEEDDIVKPEISKRYHHYNPNAWDGGVGSAIKLCPGDPRMDSCHINGVKMDEHGSLDKDAFVYTLYHTRNMGGDIVCRRGDDIVTFRVESKGLQYGSCK